MHVDQDLTLSKFAVGGVDIHPLPWFELAHHSVLLGTFNVASDQEKG